MISFFKNNHFFNTDWSLLITLRDSLLGRYSHHNAPHAGLMQKSFDNGQVLLMTSQIRSLKIKREKTSNKSPKVILKRLHINEADNILISGDKIYIEKKEMTGQHKTGRPDLAVKGGKTYVGHQDSHNGNCTALDISVESSLLNNKNKIHIKTHLNNAQNGSSDSCTKPLRQINGNVKPKSTIIISGVDGREKLNETEVINFYQSLNKFDRFYQSSDLQNQKNVRSKGILSRSIVKKPVKRLNSNPPPSFLSRLQSVFSSRSIPSANHSNPISKLNDPFRNWCSDGLEKRNNYDKAKKSCLKSPKNFLSVSQRPKDLKTSCKVTLERLDAKICFMGYLRLKPTVKTDLRKMQELSLLRKYNIRNCHVVLSRVSVEAKRKT